MNIPEVSAKYPNLGVRGIEAAIGEKSLWGQRIGTAVLGMLIEFAFHSEHVGILYCFAADYNIRSQKLLTKYGFTCVDEAELGAESIRARKEYHYALTRRDYMERCRMQALPEKPEAE